MSPEARSILQLVRAGRALLASYPAGDYAALEALRRAGFHTEARDIAVQTFGRPLNLHRGLSRRRKVAR